MSGQKIGRRGFVSSAGALISLPTLAHAANPKPKVAIKTSQGVIVVELETGKAPITAANFLRYVDSKRYDGGSFYRASRTPGAPKEGTIEGAPAATVRRYGPIAHESTRMTGLKHKTGAISIAREAPGTATADFFICANALPYLDAHPGAAGDNQGFAVFGQVILGMNVVRSILALPTAGKFFVPDMKGQMLTRPVPIITMTRST